MPHVAPLMWIMLYILLIFFILCLMCLISWYFILPLKIKTSNFNNVLSKKWNW